jgi:ribosome biogenesis SPOUT family RNA methylase Rps3
MASNSKTYIVEHLDPELGAWSELEYLAIARESHDAGAKFCLSSLPPNFKVPEALNEIPSFTAEARGVEETYANDKSRVCLLDPAAASDLAPEDGDKFDAFLFGGILGVLLDYENLPLRMSGRSCTHRRRSAERPDFRVAQEGV